MTGKAEIRKNQGKKIISNNRTLTSGFNTSRKSLISSPTAPTTTSVWQQSAKTDLNMNTYDIYDVDRILFATTLGSGDELTSTDYGIEAISSSSSGVAYGMKFRIPANKIYQMFIDTSEKINVGTGYILLNDNILTTGYTEFNAMTAPSASSSTKRRLYVDEADNHLKIRTNTSSIDIESIAGVGLGDANVWTNVNTFQNTVSMTGSTVNLGDSSSDRVNFISQVGTDINMGTYDIVNVDRFRFATTLGAGSTLISTDTGIEAVFSSGVSYGMKFVVPASNIYQMFIGSTEMVNIGTAAGFVLNDDVTIAGDLTVNDDVTITGNLTASDDVKIAASKRIRANTSTEIGYYVKNATSTVGAEGTVQIPTKNSGVTSASQANTDFGTEIGCIGLYTSGNPTLVIKYNSTAWQGIILGSSGNPTLFQI